MSPLTIDRIKKASGNVRIVPLATEGLDVQNFAIQIMENNAWVNVFVNHDKQLCEQTIRKATNKVILG